MTFDRSWWFSPKTVFGISIALCILRVAIKITIGYAISSPLLIGDGVHNIGDTGVLIAAYWVIWFMAHKSNEIYGADNLPALFQFIVALFMGTIAFWLAKESITGLITPTPRLFDSSSLGLVASAISASVAISLGVSAYQMRSSEQTLVAAGAEMRGDALIECSILAGFIGEYLLSSPSIEYCFGLLVVALIGKTAWEIGVEAKNTLLQVSLGEQFEEGIRSIVCSTYGVDEIVKLETYPVLKAARVKVWVLTRGGAEANEDIKRALVRRIRDHILSMGYAECKPDVFFDLPDRDWHRILYPIVLYKDHHFIARGLSSAHMVRVCAVENGAIVSGEDLALPQDTEALLSLIRSKHVRIYRAWDENTEIVDALKAAGITCAKTPTIFPPK